ncbi:MAG: rod shape-determining protein RodA [Actinomycetota bacterium]|nr:MAG: rod shape-determining protein RodA [Actinomycetota bacterium]
MPTRADGRSDYLGRLDWILLLAALALSVYGSILVWSASKADLAPRTGDLQYFLKRQLLNLVIGLVLGYLVSRVNHRLLRAYTPVLYVVSLIGLLVVLIPGVGSSIAGAKAWLALPGGFTIQPSEFAKVAIILMMAMILAEKRDAESEPRDADVLQALIVAAIPIAIVLVQNDTGTVLVMGTIVITIVAVSGARTRWLVGLLLGTVVAVLLAIQLHLLQPYQVDRLTSFIDPENASSQSAGFNTEQARIAVGGGGLLGRGLFEGPQTQGSFVPVNESDFVFTVAGEELGFVGGATVIVLLGVVLWRGIRIALRAEDLFGRLVATGVVAWFAFQAFENIGMTLGIMPVTGVTLPFVSYGGTSMFATWVGVGLLQNIRVHEADS